MSYNANDIISLSPGRAFREKIGMYLSADRQEAINLGLRELIVNVQDEFEVYKPENPLLKIELFSDTHIIRVSDNMRGIPSSIRDDGINSLTAAFLIPHSGGKHQDGAYTSSVGCNGEGNKVVCHTAKWLEVEVHRDGNKYFQRFESTDEGAKPMSDVQTMPEKNQKTGTIITYCPDERVYGNIFIDIEKLRMMLREMSYFTKGLKIELYLDGKKELFFSKNGLIDGLNSDFAVGAPFSYNYETSDCKVELALQWVTKKGNIKGYANGLYMPDGGVFISSFKTSLTKTFNSLAKQKFSGEQIRDCLNGFVSVKVRSGQFSNQAKTALANKEAGTATSSAISNCLKDFYNKRKNDFDKIVEVLSKIAKAEVAAERARKQVLEASKDIEKNQKRKVFASDKLKDAEFLGQDATLLLVEGLSAASSIAQARDATKWGILALRGKPINTFSNDDEKIYQNEEIKLLLSAMNIVPGKYDSKKLRYGRIGICSDTDSDGFAIGLLIMCAIYKFAPQFIEEGRLCWLRSPLHITTNGKTETYYYSDAELAQAKAKGLVKGEVQRNKGLGSLSAEQARKSMFDPAYQRLDVLKPDKDSLPLLTTLMSKDSEPKHDFIFENIDFSTIRE